MMIEMYRNRQKHENLKGRCYEYALRASFGYAKQDIVNRVALGEFKGQPHAWCEYLEGSNWLIDDQAQDIRGWSKLGVGMYKAISYEEPVWEITDPKAIKVYYEQGGR